MLLFFIFNTKYCKGIVCNYMHPLAVNVDENKVVMKCKGLSFFIAA